jgi:hypothetical protein
MRNFSTTGLALVLLAGGPALATEEDLKPVPSYKSELSPNENRYEIDSEFSRRIIDIQQQEISLEDKKKRLEELMAKYRQDGGQPSSKPSAGVLEDTQREEKKPAEGLPTRLPSVTISASRPRPRQAIVAQPLQQAMPDFAPQVVTVEPLQIFAAPAAGTQEDHVKLSAGSYARGTLMTGVDAVAGETRPMLIELDGLVRKPNGKLLDLKGCRIIAMAKGDLSSERSMIQGTKLSCSREDDNDFEVKINAFGASGDRNHLGLPGNYESRQGRVFATAALAKLAEGAGKAVAMANVNQQLTGGDNPIKVENFAGKNIVPFAVAQGTADAASMIAEWYLNEAKKLMPYIEVVSGQEAWLIMLDGVDIPNDIAGEIK